MARNVDYDVLIVGGGPAGLSAALSLSRMQVKTLLCDDSRPRNTPSQHLNTFPTRDGIHPAEWRRLAKEDVKKYGAVEFYDGSVQSLNQGRGLFVGVLASGKEITVRKIILAEGLQDRFPDIPGIRELWGKGVFHCPFCHGYEVRNRKLILLSSGDLAQHMVPMILGLSKNLLLLTHGVLENDRQFKRALQDNQVKLIETKIERVQAQGDTLKSVQFEDGSSVECDAIFLTPQLPFEIKSSLGRSLGCEINEMGLYKTGPRGETTVPGVFAAGDSINMMHSVLIASAAGTVAGAAAIHEIMLENFKQP